MAGSSSRCLLFFSDGYGRRRHGQGRRSLDYYDESELEELTRVFVALFDYDPMSMSPNMDAADEELPFKEGQIIKVLASFLDTHIHMFTTSNTWLSMQDKASWIGPFGCYWTQILDLSIKLS